MATNVIKMSSNGMPEMAATAGSLKWNVIQWPSYNIKCHWMLKDHHLSTFKCHWMLEERPLNNIECYRMLKNHHSSTLKCHSMLSYRSSITVGNGVDRWFDDIECYQTATQQHLMSLNVERPSFVNIWCHWMLKDHRSSTFDNIYLTFVDI